jgi:hypothetical protein
MVTYDARPSGFTNLTLTSEWENLFSAAGIPSGIDVYTGSAMAPSLDSAGRNAVIADGNVVIKGQLWRCDAPVSTPIPAASAQNRIDRLVLRLNRGATSSPTVVQPVIITGTPSGSPVEPPIVQTTAGIWDIPVFSWTSNSSGTLTGLVDERQFNDDVWHDLRPASAGWSGSQSGEYPPQYRKTPDGQHVEIFGIINLGSPYTGVNIFPGAVPPSYRPNHTVRMPVQILANGTSNVINSPVLTMLTTGFLQFNNFPTGLAGTNVFMNSTYPLDSSGLVQV